MKSGTLKKGYGVSLQVGCVVMDPFPDGFRLHRLPMHAQVVRSLHPKTKLPWRELNARLRLGKSQELRRSGFQL